MNDIIKEYNLRFSISSDENQLIKLINNKLTNPKLGLNENPNMLANIDALFMNHKEYIYFVDNNDNKFGLKQFSSNINKVIEDEY